VLIVHVDNKQVWQSFVCINCWFVQDAEVELQETAEYQSAKETLEETRAVAKR